MHESNTHNYKIRTANSLDCQKLAVLAAQVWLDTYATDGIRPDYAEYANSTFTTAYFQSLLKHSDYRLLVCEQADMLQGFVLVNLAAQYQTPDNGYEIDKLYVHRSFQGKGAGRALLSRVASHYGTPMWLYTWTENTANQFYRRLGAKQIGTLSFEAFGSTINNNVYKISTVKHL
ncbi:GNAT family N-acetyltransferase [Pseudoalteromonas sp. OOF1S-7]|uniref:GNAT family N-acetyltransferase n=1 Tax=Pseudoalteromonas sp. OOF1S-7 TaxID=2917757 RepID=UPI001EF3E3AF|nr:GNAT family N-acetyltransferase [Pseudoalteromonas sp. OOF1S-7]MCG7534264.1 GNAT family N-acetyltransferase [Pseudoalteromonas sp. OOF1S-7]